MKKIMAMLLMVVTIFSSTAVFADFSDVSDNSGYYDAANRLRALNIMVGTSENEFSPDSMVTRAQFSAIMVKAAGLKDTAESMNGISAYSDVDPASPMSGYINVAVSKGFLTGAIDGNFHPDENVSYAQVCTAVVRALGYTDNDVQGLWPKNYVEKASKLEITKGISFNYNDSVPRWAMAVIVDKLLDTNVKKAADSIPDKTFSDASALYTECIILDNSLTSDKLADNQVLTDKGIFYYDNKSITLELGNTYRLDIDDEDKIEEAYGMQKSLEGYSVDGSVGTKISYRNDNNETLYMTLPDKTVYYYNGAKISYDKVKGVLQTRSSIVFALNKSKLGYDYAVIYDPIYSDPEVARGFQPADRQLGSIAVNSDSEVIRDGELADIMKIREKDVVYNVSDIWNKYSYILAVSDKVGGRVDDVLPDRVTPKSVMVDGKEYGFSGDIDINKLSVRPGTLEEDDNIVMLLGHDGKVVDLEYPGNDDNSNYAVVLNTYVKIEGNSTGKVDFTYSAKLLTADGITATYYTTDDPANFKGRMVTYKWKDSKHVKLEFLSYNYPKGVSLNKSERNINGSFVADNVKIFNIVSDELEVDSEAKLIDIQDLPEGAISDGKIWHIQNAGSFDDVSVILTNDILGEREKTGIIENVIIGNNGKSYFYRYTILVEGKEYIYEEPIASGRVGSVVDLRMVDGKIDFVGNAKEPDFKYSSVEAYDSRRIKVNGRVFWFDKNISVYFLDYDGNVEVKSLADVEIDDMYGAVQLFLDKSTDEGGKVQVILIKK